MLEYIFLLSINEYMNKKLSILIPVYNEESTILTILKRINECRIIDFVCKFFKEIKHFRGE